MPFIPLHADIWNSTNLNNDEWLGENTPYWIQEQKQRSLTGSITNEEWTNKPASLEAKLKHSCLRQIMGGTNW